MRKQLTYWLLMAFVGLLLAACASIGSPEGGPRDYTPPQVVKTSPQAGALNFTGQKVEITLTKSSTSRTSRKRSSSLLHRAWRHSSAQWARS